MLGAALHPDHIPRAPRAQASATKTAHSNHAPFFHVILVISFFYQQNIVRALLLMFRTLGVDLPFSSLK